MLVINQTLTPATIRFINAFMIYNNASKAVRLAFPESKNWHKDYIKVKGHRMITDDNVKQEIQNRKAVMEQNANLGAARLQKIIKEGKEHNALEASKFSIEQMDGKATQLKEIKGGFVVAINYDLSGGTGGQIPQSVLDELAEDDD